MKNTHKIETGGGGEEQGVFAMDIHLGVGYVMSCSCVVYRDCFHVTMIEI